MNEQPLFHVVLQGRKVGPYDRRTIVGMRIKGTLESAHVLIDTEGNQLTVADLIGRRPRADAFQPNRTSGQAVVQAIYPASLRGVAGKGHGIPAFQGEVEARLQNDALRIAGRFRKGLGWKEDRVKLPLDAIVHAGARGSEVQLGVRGAEPPGLCVVRLELFTAEAAAELVARLPSATGWPPQQPAAAQHRTVMNHRLLWLLAGAGLVLAVLFARRPY